MKYFLFLLFCLSLLLNCSSDTYIDKEQKQANLVSLKDSLPIPTLSMDSIHYDFVAYDKNRIQRLEALSHFFQQLKKLEAGDLRQVRIAHIGDSHIQADFLPGKMRYLLQHQFGNAGRGLVFPYQQAGTHSPIDFKTESEAEFESKRSVFKKGGPSIGISGMSIQAKSAEFDIYFYLKERYGLLEPFDRLSIMKEPTENDPKSILKVREEELAPLPSSDPGQLIFQLPEGATSATLSVKNQLSSDERMTIHGWLLENTQQPGILYNMMGVNGTTYFHFNRCEYFLPELEVLNPDLIIISLGTNEALTSNFTTSALRREADNFLAQVRESCPQSSILITTLPEAWQRKERPNPHVEPARQALTELASDFETARWDLYEVMGGRGAMQYWVEAELGYVDYIHFTQLGYELQADLLYTALMKAYHEYR
jgi:hypothetical protein